VIDRHQTVNILCYFEEVLYDYLYVSMCYFMEIICIHI